MEHFLVIFDRLRGKILEFATFSNGTEALRARFKAETANQGQDDIEVVVLVADSIDTLHKTHARYFRDMSDLVERAAETPLDRPSRRKSILSPRTA